MIGIVTNLVTCRFCQRQVSALDAAGNEATGRICPRCIEWHVHAMQVAGGGVPRGCQSCERDLDQLKERSNGVEVRMYLVPKDGIYQVLCGLCAGKYLPKRRDLYGATQFGKQHGLN